MRAESIPRSHADPAGRDRAGARPAGADRKPSSRAEQPQLFAKERRVLVTGGTGFVGSHLVERLVRRGYKVRLLLRRTSSLRWLEGIPVEYAVGDVRDKASLAGACVNVHAVFHFGGVTRAYSASDFTAANAGGTRKLAEAFSERGEPGGFFVYCSSLAAGGPAVAFERDPEPVRTESDPSIPVTPYGRSKLEGEVALREVADAHGRFRHVVLRPPAVYGPRDENSLKLFRMVRNGFLPMPRGTVNRTSLIFVEDLADAAIRAAESSSRGTYYLSDGGIYTWEEIGRRAAEIMEVEVRPLRVPKPLALFGASVAELGGFVVRRPAFLNRAKVRDLWQPHWVCSPEKARRDWGFEPRFPLMQGLEETLSWYRLNQWL